MNEFSQNDWDQCFTGIQNLLKRMPTTTEQLNLIRYTEQLLIWNRTYNLIGPTATTATNLINRHILNSLTLLPLLPNTGKIADMGTGAGFPGVILAILSNTPRTFHLYESSHKKTRFLNFIITDLQLKQHITIHCQQVEQSTQAAGYDIVTSRALANLEQVAKLAKHLLHPNGISLALKGKGIHEEIKQFLSSPIAKHFSTPQILTTPGDGESVIVQMQKVSRETRPTP